MQKPIEYRFESDDLSIRDAQPEDCAVIIELIRGLAEYEKLLHECKATPELLKQTLFATPRPAESMLAFWAGKPVGFSLFFTNYSTFLSKPGIYLEDLFVLPDFRGRGIGKALLNQLAKLTIERNGGRLEWSVLDWNKPAIDFYLSIGAKPMDEWTMYRLSGEGLRRFAESNTN